MIETIFRDEWSQLVAYLCGLFRDIHVAEEAAQEAFEAAARAWPRDGVPESPRAWLRTTGRRKAIDALRRDKRVDVGLDESLPSAVGNPGTDAGAATAIPDGRLELIFACCHPALSREAQVALVLRSLIGMSTVEIARAFLVPEETMKRRLTRAKAKIRDAGIPFAMPRPADLDTRVDAVLTVIYLIFNAGYAGRAELADQAIWLARVMSALLPDSCRIHGLLALMLFHGVDRHPDAVHHPGADRGRARARPGRLVACGVAVHRSAAGAGLRHRDAEQGDRRGRGGVGGCRAVDARHARPRRLPPPARGPRRAAAPPRPERGCPGRVRPGMGVRGQRARSGVPGAETTGADRAGLSPFPGRASASRFAATCHQRLSVTHPTPDRALGSASPGKRHGGGR
ncbi:sigma-70 family RNA polymerase sigma factor [Microbacterium sp. EF45047]|nr:sigma-70 family RNA polymerase sigma factor [Microbacterium neungamense]WCM54966.1 sigma-70 family RNA polymerase sigma factor [Microbacterium sp. EF45047]